MSQREQKFTNNVPAGLHCTERCKAPCINADSWRVCWVNLHKLVNLEFQILADSRLCFQKTLDFKDEQNAENVDSRPCFLYMYAFQTTPLFKERYITLTQSHAGNSTKLCRCHLLVTNKCFSSNLLPSAFFLSLGKNPTDSPDTGFSVNLLKSFPFFFSKLNYKEPFLNYRVS